MGLLSVGLTGRAADAGFAVDANVRSVSVSFVALLAPVRTGKPEERAVAPVVVGSPREDPIAALVPDATFFAGGASLPSDASCAVAVEPVAFLFRGETFFAGWSSPLAAAADVSLCGISSDVSLPRAVLRVPTRRASPPRTL